jgi:Cu/Zn superoxide dismutase
MTGLEVAGNKYHVHVFPTAAAGGADDAGCGGGITGGHFNPTLTDGSVTKEVGDLSGKHGLMTPTNEKDTFSDPDLPLSGDMSVVGRSIVIHKADGTRWVCANIGKAGMGFTVTFPVKAGYPSGTMQLFQASESSKTTVSVSMTGAEAAGNKYHVHVLPTAAAGGADDAGCGKGVTGGHFNPTFTDGTVTKEVGDLSGKHGPLTPTTSKAFYTDATLPLLGSMSVVGRSIVIHKNNGDRWVCANIGTAGTGYTVTFPVKVGYPSGSVQLFQATPTSKTAVTVSMSGMEAAGNMYHVHMYAVSDTLTNNFGDAACAPAGGHFMVGTPAVDYGDLNGRHGKLTAAVSQVYYEDAYLALGDKATSPNTVVGRSIVVHKAVGDRWACANIGPLAAAITPAGGGGTGGTGNTGGGGGAATTATTYDVTGVVTLNGASAATFNDAEKKGLTSVIATTAGVATSQVTLTTEATNCKPSAWVDCPLEVTYVVTGFKTKAAADTAAAALRALFADPADALTKLKVAGGVGSFDKVTTVAATPPVVEATKAATPEEMGAGVLAAICLGVLVVIIVVVVVIYCCFCKNRGMSPSKSNNWQGNPQTQATKDMEMGKVPGANPFQKSAAGVPNLPQGELEYHGVYTCIC